MASYPWLCKEVLLMRQLPWLLLSLLGFTHVTFAQPQWHVEEVYISSGTLYDVDIALDSAEEPHIVFCDGSNLWLADRTSGNWSAGHLVSGLGNLNYASIDFFNSSGYPAVAYTYKIGVPPYLDYTWFDGSDWQTENVDLMWSQIRPVILDIDENDTPHILYSMNSYDNPPYDTHSYLFHARKPRDDWMIETIIHLISIYNGFVHTYDFAIHPSGVARAIMGRDYLGSAEWLHFAWPDTFDIWQHNIAENNISLGGRVGMSIGSDNMARLSFRKNTGFLFFAVGDSTGFTSAPVDTSFQCGQYNSIAVDGYDAAHISYSTPEGLRYAIGDLSGWEFTDIETAVSGIGDIELVLNGLNEPRIAWLDGNTVKYAWFGNTTSITGSSELVEVPFSLRILPNPSLGSPIATVYNPSEAIAHLNVFDMSGRQVLRIEQLLTPGVTMIGFGDIPPGVYFCRMVSGDLTATKRFVIIQ